MGYPVNVFGIVAEKNQQLIKQQITLPSLRENELLIEVHAAGVNRADIEQANGNYPPPPGASPVLGLEVSGVVIDKGSHVKSFEIGDRVMSLVAAGAYANYAIAPEETTLLIPPGFSFYEAAAIPEAYYTIWYNVFTKGNLRKGDFFLVHGGVSGVGSAAVQVAKLMGATVVATIGGDNKKEACYELGADFVINYHTDHFEKAVLEFTHNQGIDVILDWVGAQYLSIHLNLLKKYGRLLVINSKACEAAIDFELLLMKCLTISGSLLRPLSLLEKAKLTKDIKEILLPKVIESAVRPLIYKILPIENAKKAHQMLENSMNIGKVILALKN